MAPRRICVNGADWRRTYYPHYHVVSSTIVLMPFLDRVDGELPPLLQCTGLSSLDLKREISRSSFKHSRSRERSTSHPYDSG